MMIVPLPTVRITMTTSVVRKAVHDRNVVAAIEGSDPRLKDEWVVITGHVDHNGAVGDTMAQLTIHGSRPGDQRVMQNGVNTMGVQANGDRGINVPNLATASVAVTVRQATRAPDERPPTKSGRSRSSVARRWSTTAIHAVSS